MTSKGDAREITASAEERSPDPVEAVVSAAPNRDPPPYERRTGGLSPLADHRVFSDAENKLRNVARNEASSVEEIALAMKAVRDHLRPRLERRSAPTRAVAAVLSFGILDVEKKALGLSTEQGDISRTIFARSMAQARDAALTAVNADPVLVDKVERAVDLAIDMKNRGIADAGLGPLSSRHVSRTDVERRSRLPAPRVPRDWSDKIRSARRKLSRLFQSRRAAADKTAGVLRRDDVKQQDVDRAIERGIQTNRARVEASHAPFRVLQEVAGTYGLNSVNRIASGMRTDQSKIGQWLHEQAEDRVVRDALIATNGDEKRIAMVGDAVNRSRASRGYAPHRDRGGGR